jgi:hypothetical protein
MSIFINFEAGHLEIWNFIDEAPILCAQGNMLGHRHIKSTAIDDGTPGLLRIYRSLTLLRGS